MPERFRTIRVAGRIRERISAAREASGVEATYAATLDGCRLWLALPDTAGEPALQAPDGRLLFPRDELTTERVATAGLRSIRWHVLDALAGEPPGEYAVVVRRDDRPSRVRLPQALPSGPTTAPRSVGRQIIDLVCSKEGELSVVLTARGASSAELVDASYADGAATIELSTDSEAEQLLLLDASDSVAATIGVEATTDLVKATFTARTLPSDLGNYRVVLGTDRLAVVRRANGLRNARKVLLPFVLAEGSDDVYARLRFRADGQLVVARVEPQEAQ